MDRSNSDAQYQIICIVSMNQNTADRRFFNDLSTAMINFNEIFYQNTESLWEFSGVWHANSTITFISDIMRHIAVYQHWYTLWYVDEDEML